MTKIQFRRGACASCGAMYKLPATFAADKARCKECGGVVEVGPVETKAAPSTPAKAAAQPVTARTAQQPGRPRPGAKAPAARPAQSPVTSKRRPVAAVEDDDEDEPRGGTRRSSGGGSSRKRSSRGRSSRARGDSGDDGGGRKRRGREKSKSPLVLLAAVLVLAGGGGATWWLMNQDKPAQAAETDKPAEQAGQDATGPGAANPIEDSTPLEDTTSGREDTASSDSGSDATAAVEADSGAPSSGGGLEDAAGSDETKGKKEADPSKVDLTSWADWERVEGTTDEEWEQLQAWMADFADPYAPGKKFGEARTGLIAASKKAMPVILNEFKSLDVSTELDRKMGDQIQRELLQEICGGTNWDWRYDEEPGSQYFNKRVIESWLKAWSQAYDNDLGWSNLSKIPLEELNKEETQKKKKALEGLDDF